MKCSVLAFISFSAVACASGARPELMTVYPADKSTVSEHSKFYKSISVDSVSGGQETNPLWTSEVSNTAFQKALKDSLRAYGMLSDSDNGKYLLNS